MKHPIQKERLHLMSPCVNVCASAIVNACPDALSIQNAVQNAARSHDILGCRAEIESNGKAYLVQSDTEKAVIPREFSESAEELIVSQDNKPFAIDAGETVRVFYKNRNGRTEIVVIAHHVVCDGGSIMILMRDILLSLNGRKLSRQPVRLLTADDMPRRARLNLPMRLMMKLTNLRWAKSGKTFDYEAYRRMFKSYCADHKTIMLTRTITANQVNTLKDLSRGRGITLNSLLTAAFASTVPTGESVGIPVDVRTQNMTGLGNYAIGVSVKPEYDEKKSVIDNAVIIHKLIQDKLDRPKDRYFLNDFMGSISPTLTDSIYFSAYDGFENPISKSLSEMCGYVSDPKGITITNLKTVQAQSDTDGRYNYEKLVFIPPYIPNVRSVVGVSTYNGEMTIILRAPDGERGISEAAKFDKALDLLNGIT